MTELENGFVKGAFETGVKVTVEVRVEQDILAVVSFRIEWLSAEVKSTLICIHVYPWGRVSRCNQGHKHKEFRQDWLIVRQRRNDTHRPNSYNREITYVYKQIIRSDN